MRVRKFSYSMVFTMSKSSIILEKLNCRYWEKIPLEKMTTMQWESLCDGCGKCCLHTFNRDNKTKIDRTNVACKLLDLKTGKCSNYSNRFKYVPKCFQLDMEKLKNPNWLPSTCAYRLIANNKALPDWHPLITGDRDSVLKANMSVVNMDIISELDIDDEPQDHTIKTEKWY